MTDDQVRALILKRAKPFAKRRGSTGILGWCAEHGIPKSHASEFMNGKRAPVTSILNALGLEWRVVRKDKRQPTPHPAEGAI